MGMRGRRIVVRIGIVVSVGAVGYLLIAFLAAPVRDFSAASGLVGGVVGALGLALAAIGLLLPTDPNAVRADLARRLAREWDREAVARGLERPEPLRVRWSSTERPVAAELGELQGDVTTIADVWRGLPSRQLVVIGEAGAGKTSAAVILVRRLLATWGADEPVPVLLNVADWRPEREHLDAWSARKLRGLGIGRKDATGMVDRGEILPVLDGLDEMDLGGSDEAVRALTDAVGMDGPIVVTCRAADYEHFVRATGTPLARADVVEIGRVDPSDVIDYLPAGQLDGKARWAAVLDRLRAEPDGPLATALRTPLMVFLARAEYGRPGADPVELLTLSDVDAIENALLAGYVPAVYRDRGPVRPGEKAPPAYAPTDVLRWLDFLAGRVADGPSGLIGWWRLGLSLPDEPKAVPKGPPAWSVWWILRGSQWLAGLVMTGSVVMAILELTGALDDAMRWSPRQSITLLSASLTMALVAGWTHWRVNVGRAPRSLSRDLCGPLGAAVVAWLSMTLVLGSRIAVPGYHWATGLLVPMAVALLWPWTSPLGAFHLAAWRLSRRGLVPFRLMPFLEDAYRRGVLRKTSGEYQFRHARLAEHLAAQANGPEAEAPGPSTKH